MWPCVVYDASATMQVRFMHLVVLDSGTLEVAGFTGHEPQMNNSSVSSSRTACRRVFAKPMLKGAVSRTPK